MVIGLRSAIFVIGAFLINFAHYSSAISCYECDSNEDVTCPQSEKFNTEVNPLVDCNAFEVKVPGTFCVKQKQESPGWYGWIKITRRCGTKADTGVAWGCRYWFEDNGVFKEVCYCDNSDGCNSASQLSSSFVSSMASLSTFIAILAFYFTAR